MASRRVDLCSPDAYAISTFILMVDPYVYVSYRNAPNQTTVFSLLHPLDEVAPVITKTGKY